MNIASNKIVIYAILSIGIVFTSCRKKEGCTDSEALNFDSKAKRDNGTCQYDIYNPTAYNLEIPYTLGKYLPAPLIPEDNPMTEEGVALGRKLFYENLLSGNNTQNCASCHLQEHAFADPAPFSTGIDGLQGARSAMPIWNMAWNSGDKFFWDGRVEAIEGQALKPVVDVVEMHAVWPNVVDKLQAHSEYPDLFKKAFGTDIIDSNLVVKAIAQFERTLMSGNSKFDKYLNGQAQLTPSELNGYNIFMDEAGGDCFHCHGEAVNPLWTDNDFHNNGLDATHSDLGLGAVTGNANDNGKFKTPSLRNLIYTAPYMHDSRFNTLDEVINFYSIGLQYSSTIDPLMKNVSAGGVQLNPQDRLDLKAFLLTLTDESFINNPNYSNPN